MRHFIISVFLILLISTGAPAAEIVAKTKTGLWTISVIVDGDHWKDTCSLTLTAETYQLKKEISLKRPQVNCALFGPVQVIASKSTDSESTIVFLEAARGGDGDHSGPIIEVFKLTKRGFQKLGEQEMFDATYNKKDKQITAITGSVLYSLCDTCDGPDASDPDDNFYIPSKMDVNPTAISVKPTISKQERKALLDRFDSQSTKAIKDNEFNKNYQKFIADLRQQLMHFLMR